MLALRHRILSRAFRLHSRIHRWQVLKKIGDLDSELDLGYSSYVHDPNPGDIAYWSPQPRVVLYYGDVGAWDGIHVIGSFDEEDKEAADAELSETSYDFEVTI